MSPEGPAGVFVWLTGRSFASLTDAGLCACNRSGLATLALTPVHKPTRCHFTLITHQQGVAVDSRSHLGVRIRKPKPFFSCSYFSKESRQASSSSLVPEVFKQLLKADLFLQGDSTGAAFPVWDGSSGASHTTLLEHGGRSASLEGEGHSSDPRKN